MIENVQQLTSIELRRFLIDEIKHFSEKLEAGRPLRELNEKRKHITRIYKLLEEQEKIELSDIFGNSFLQILTKER